MCGWLLIISRLVFISSSFYSVLQWNNAQIIDGKINAVLKLRTSVLIVEVNFFSTIRRWMTSFPQKDLQVRSPHFLVRGQQWKYQNIVCNLFKVHSKDVETTPLTSFWCLYCCLWKDDFTYRCGIRIVDFEQVNAAEL